MKYNYYDSFLVIIYVDFVMQNPKNQSKTLINPQNKYYKIDTFINY